MLNGFLKTIGLGGPGQGHTLGATTSSSTTSPPNHNTFTVSFGPGDQSLGMAIEPDMRGRPFIAAVAANGAAQQKGVLQGDIVVAVDGNVVASFDSLFAILPGLGRPVVFRLERPGFNELAGPVSTGEAADREARRLAMVRAAEERSAAWGQRVVATKGQKAKAKEAERERAAQDIARFEAATDQQTMQLVQAAKAREAHTAQAFGYNPYAPQMSSMHLAHAARDMVTPGPMQGGADMDMGPGYTLGGAGAPGGYHAPPPPPQEPLPEPLSQAELQSAEAHTAGEQVDAALAVLLSQERGVWHPALSTVVKILANVVRDPGHEKFRRIRLANPAFQAKVGSVAGGLDLLHAAGFSISAEGEEAFLVIPHPSPLLPLATRVACDHVAHTLEQAEGMD